MEAERALLTDIDALTQLRIAYLKEDFGSLAEETEKSIRAQLPGYFERHLNRDLFAYVLRRDEKIISCAFLLLSEKPMSPSFINGKTASVLNVYTEPEERHKGYGLLVIEKMLKEAEEMDICTIELKSTGAGYRLYQKAGFKDAVSHYRDMVWKNK